MVAIKCINLEKCQTSVDELSHEIQVVTQEIQKQTQNQRKNFTNDKNTHFLGDVAVLAPECRQLLHVLRAGRRALGGESLKRGPNTFQVMRLLNSGSMLDIIKRKVKAIGKEAAMNGVLDEATIATVLKEVLKVSNILIDI